MRSCEGEKNLANFSTFSPNFSFQHQYLGETSFHGNAQVISIDYIFFLCPCWRAAFHLGEAERTAERGGTFE